MNTEIVSAASANATAKRIWSAPVLTVLAVSAETEATGSAGADVGGVVGFSTLT